jgi:DNA-binding transcriptional LysR family regulator
MELRQLRQFTALAETLNFRAAAKRLHMSQPPLSVSIRNLEEEVGVKLFTRTTHDVQLTEAGRSALSDARRTLFHAAEVARVAQAVALGLSGRLRIGFVGSAKCRLLPRILPAFRKQYHEVKLELHEGTNTTIIESLEASNLDLGIVRVPFTWQSSIEYVTVERDIFVAALPARHPLAKKPRLSLRDIAKEPFIHYKTSVVPGLHAMTMLLFQDAGFMPRVTQEAVQVETAICLVESGLGVALVPSIASCKASRGIVFRKLYRLPAVASIGLALAYDPNHETATARRFREFVPKA